VTLESPAMTGGTISYIMSAPSIIAVYLMSPVPGYAFVLIFVFINISLSGLFSVVRLLHVCRNFLFLNLVNFKEGVKCTV
jgi:hypothetical protein